MMWGRRTVILLAGVVSGFVSVACDEAPSRRLRRTADPSGVRPIGPIRRHHSNDHVITVGRIVLLQHTLPLVHTALQLVVGALQPDPITRSHSTNHISLVHACVM